MTQHEKRTQLMHLLYQYDFNMKLEIKANYLSDASLLDELTTITNHLNDIDEIIEFAKDWLGKKFVNHQTGDEGKPVSAIMIAESTKIQKEFFIRVGHTGS